MKSSVYVSIALVAMVLGIMMAFQYRTTGAAGNGVPLNREQELVTEKKQLEKDLNQLRDDVTDLSATLDKAGIGQDEANEVLEKELTKTRRYAGLVPVSGPGVEILIDSLPNRGGPGTAHRSKNITDEDLLKIVNNLRSAGAEAIAVNEQRILAISEIRLAGNNINVNTIPISPPYCVVAIGNPTELKSRLEIKEGLVEYLTDSGFAITVEVKSSITIPAFTGAVNFEYAKPTSKSMEF